MINDKLHYISLANVDGVGVSTFLKLLKHFGSASNVYAQTPQVLASFVSMAVAQNILRNNSLDKVAKIQQWVLEKENRYIITLEDDNYPYSLAEIDTPPVLLFAEGNIGLLANNNKLAMVGARNPSPQGLENAKMFAHDLSSSGITIVSGLALGIDAASHIGALSGIGSTIAVLGTGIDMIYPKSNTALTAQVKQHGLVLSEYPLGTPPMVANFPRRNRIVVGLSRACLVVESAIDGGSMISARYALDYGRDVMAIPGSIHNPLARGCHKLIKQGAKLIETVTDIKEEIFVEDRQIKQAELAIVETDVFLQQMGFDPITLDKLNTLVKMDFGQLCGKLLEYELSGVVVNCGGGKYQRIK